MKWLIIRPLPHRRRRMRASLMSDYSKYKGSGVGPIQQHIHELFALEISQFFGFLLLRPAAFSVRASCPPQLVPHFQEYLSDLSTLLLPVDQPLVSLDLMQPLSLLLLRRRWRGCTLLGQLWRDGHAEYLLY